MCTTRGGQRGGQTGRSSGTNAMAGSRWDHEQTGQVH